MSHGGAAGQLDHGLGLLAVATHAVSHGVVHQYPVVCTQRMVRGEGGATGQTFRLIKIIIYSSFIRIF